MSSPVQRKSSRHFFFSFSLENCKYRILCFSKKIQFLFKLLSTPLSNREACSLITDTVKNVLKLTCSGGLGHRREHVPGNTPFLLEGKPNGTAVLDDRSSSSWRPTSYIMIISCVEGSRRGHSRVVLKTRCLVLNGKPNAMANFTSNSSG